jgi:hypothetical protein
MDKEQGSVALRSAHGVLKSRVPIDPAQVRRGILFLVNVGVPILGGALRGEPRAALVGAIVGMVLSFADNEGQLLSRLRLLTMAASCMVAGGLAGHFLRSTAPVLWPLFVAVTFAAGLAARAGREPLLAARNGAMAFAVTAGIPAIEMHEIWYLVGGLILNAASRTVDYLIAGPLPRIPATPLQMPSGRGGWFRFALAYAAAATAALWVGMTRDPIHAIWVVTTTLVVMQPDARASYRRIVERIAGTFAGVVAAWAITIATESPVAICAAILMVAPLIPHHLANRYWLHTALIALMILLAYDLTALNSHGITDLLTERLTDMLLGCAMALVGTAAAFPRRAVSDLDGLVEDRPSGHEGSDPTGTSPPVAATDRHEEQTMQSSER